MMNWFRRLMIGRNGVDQLSLALVILGLVFSIVARIADWQWLYLLCWAPLILSYFRIFSRNVYKRRAENQKFLGVWWKIKGWFSGLGRTAQDRKTHRYYQCPQCKQKLRVPRGKGRINIRCPKCGTEFIRKT